jgi:hypothetical protein
MSRGVGTAKRPPIDERGHSETDGGPMTGEPIAQRPQHDLDRLLAAIQSHEGSEIDAVDAYRNLAREASDPVIRSLLHILVQDEEHHHRVLRAIAMELRAVVSTGGRELDVLPRAVEGGTTDSLRMLARREREGVTELRDLAKEAPTLLGGLFSLLLGLMALDSEKHELILLYVLKELEAAGRLPGQAS